MFWVQNVNFPGCFLLTFLHICSSICFGSRRVVPVKDRHERRGRFAWVSWRARFAQDSGPSGLWRLIDMCIFYLYVYMTRTQLISTNLFLGGLTCHVFFSKSMRYLRILDVCNYMVAWKILPFAKSWSGYERAAIIVFKYVFSNGAEWGCCTSLHLPLKLP